jgi:hypothetical protein
MLRISLILINHFLEDQDIDIHSKVEAILLDKKKTKLLIGIYSVYIFY